MSREVIVNEIHKQSRKNFKRRSVLQRGINDTFQADLVEMIPHSKENNNFKYILTVIDIFSKYAFAVAVRNKNGSTITEAMQYIISKNKIAPKNLQTDEGKEFFNKEFQNLMKLHGVNHYHSYSSMKASIVERFNRTLKTIMYKKFSLNGNYKWVNILGDLVKLYNNRVHRTIKMKPKDVTIKDEKKLLSIYKKAQSTPSLKHHTKIRFNVGDYVRISRAKGVFTKGYLPNWSTEIFQVQRILSTSPTTYILKDLSGENIRGCFYKEELQRTNETENYLVEKVLRRRGNDVFVKWLGFDDSNNSWIPKQNLL